MNILPKILQSYKPPDIFVSKNKSYFFLQATTRKRRAKKRLLLSRVRIQITCTYTTQITYLFQTINITANHKLTIKHNVYSIIIRPALLLVNYNGVYMQHILTKLDYVSRLLLNKLEQSRYNWYVSLNMHVNAYYKLQVLYQVWVKFGLLGALYFKLLSHYQYVINLT